MDNNFKCTQCAKCCNQIGKVKYDKLFDWEKEIIEEMKESVNSIPIVPLNDECDGLFLYNWEYNRIKRIARERNIEIQFKINSVVLDLNTNKSLILDWYIETKECPFLLNNHCTIYKERPFECKQYPINIQMTPDGKLMINFNICPNLSKNILNLDEGSYKTYKNNKVEQIYKIRESYGEIFTYAFQQYYCQQFMIDCVHMAIHRKIIRPALKYPLKYLYRRIENSEKMSIVDFLIEKKFMTVESYNLLIEKFEKCEIAKEQIKNMGI